MALAVKRTSRGLIVPSEPIPSVTLDLSVIDRLPITRSFYVRTLHVFRHGPEAARVIKEALSKALVPYYPLAGRLQESSQGLLQVECSGQGAWFVEASADCTLEDVNYFDNMLFVPEDELLPDCTPEVDGMEPLVQVQVTQFACGGFVIGLRFCHTICDGLGAAQFLNAVGELARGLQHPTISPVWCRDFLPPILDKSNAIPLPPLPIPTYTLEPAIVDLPIDRINLIKREFHMSTGQHCSTFEVVVALLWKCRTMAVELELGTEVRLCFFASCRQLVDPPLPEGFYGNAFFLVTALSSSESLEQASYHDLIKMIQDAKAILPQEFGKYAKGEHLKKGNKDPFLPPPIFTTFFVSEWGRLGFNQVDYGWGPPVHVVPIQGSNVIPGAIVGSIPLRNKGIRVTTWCVEEASRQKFIDLMTKAI